MRLRTTALLALAGGLIAVPAATAHVTLSVDRVGAGEFTYFDVRVPNERAGASTTRVSVDLPPGLTFVQAQVKPGWRVSMTKQRDRVVRVSWRGGRIGPDRFDMFGLSARFPERGRTLVFPAVHTLTHRAGAPNADEPAPRVRVTRATSSHG
jgi:periplasmic copper chaperone A